MSARDMVLRRCSRGIGLSLGILAGIAGTAVFEGTALADSFAGTRFDLEERVDSVDVRLEHGCATLVVTRVVENPANKSDQAMFHIDMPEGGVATRLRTAGTGKNGETIWFEGELMEAEAAAKKYQELTGIGGYYPKDPALLSWRGQRHLALQVFPVLARSSKTVEYTVKMPMEYVEGAYKMTVSKLGTDALPAKIKFSSAIPDEGIEVNGIAILPGAPITAARDLEVRLKPRPASPTFEGGLASFGFAPDRVLVHARVATAPKLSQAPVKAAVVVLVDTSVSMENQIDAELGAVRAYLSQFPTADVEILTFDRKVQSPFGGFIPSKNALSRLYAFKPTSANGSNFDEAIARADAHLAAQTTAPVKRILLLTDLKTREALTPDRFGAKTLASGALLHMATVDHGGATLLRDDESAWAKLPRATGGLFWKATCDAVSANSAAQRSVFEEWVRPKKIDRVKVTGLPTTEFTAPEQLLEGEGIEHFVISQTPVSQVTIEGEMWSKPVRWSMSPSAEEGKKWAGLVFGSSLLGQITEKEQMTLAMHGGAVSPVTSYLAIEPGVRPSTEGLEDGEVGIGGGTGTGQGFGNGHGRLGGMHMQAIDRSAFLNAELKKAADKCAMHSGDAITVSVESTVREIVEVKDAAITPARNAKIEACVTEELWGVSLPTQFTEEHEDWPLSVRL